MLASSPWHIINQIQVLKLNTYGSSIGNPGLSGFGGLFQNSHGHQTLGYYGWCGFTTKVNVELFSIYEGLKLVWCLVTPTFYVNQIPYLLFNLFSKGSIIIILMLPLPRRFVPCQIFLGNCDFNQGYLESLRRLVRVPQIRLVNLTRRLVKVQR